MKDFIGFIMLMVLPVLALLGIILWVASSIN